MTVDESFMQRALQLAEYGRGHVSPNPMVGCVLVAAGQIIGEGWHRNYGGPHAEVQAVRDAEKRGNENLLKSATAYVTLEPCSHFGKTPPCADLLINKKIKRVVVANHDPNPLVAGRGLTMLQEAGIEVVTGILTNQGQELNRRFFNFFTKKRPYVILKWAETADGFIAAENGTPLPISNSYSSQRVHRWRGEEDAILVGRQTALNDNPRLNIRHWPGVDPVRVVLDRKLALPETLHLFDRSQPTIVYNYAKKTHVPDAPERYTLSPSLAFSKIKKGENELSQILADLHARKIQSVLVEGGAQIISSFIEAGLWDEIRRCQSPLRLSEVCERVRSHGTEHGKGGDNLLRLEKGVFAPVVAGTLVGSENIDGDLWTYCSKVAMWSF